MKKLLAAMVLLAAGLAHAHKPSDSYLSIDADGSTLRGRWDIALRDLEYAIGLDADGDGRITWGELKAKQRDIDAYALSRLALKADGAPCRLSPTEHLVDEHTDGAYTVLRFSADCGGAPYKAVVVRYGLFFDLDPTHRGLLRVNVGGQAKTAVLSPQHPEIELSGTARSKLEQFGDYLREGVWHIWIGFDHVLFLVSLLLPAVFTFQGTRWLPAERFGEAFWDVFKVATSFTIAHSVTLSLAALSVISLPSRLVESAIALSVVLAASNNLWPLVHGRRWLVAFGFGLIHGFGFASVLTDLGLPRDTLLLALVGFNGGVEVGQLAIISVFLPLAFALRQRWIYRRLIFVGGSAAIVVVAAIWMVERVFDVQFGLI